ncbi:EamA family transporter [Haloarchaeobius sp. TZWWS8]|uniref:EamA family transporter n=1 Tax=Haloarchaeobius sp. TZWWS8 TaxID=3446121 RepID=UPI003EBF3767
MFNSAVAWALLAMVAWGCWAVVADVATRTVSPTVAMTVSYLVGTALAGAYVVTRPESITYTREGLAVAAVAGVFSGIGAVAFYAGLERGDTTGVVTTISALYFVVAAALAIAFLEQPLELTDAAGFGFAVLAVVLLTN